MLQVKHHDGDDKANLMLYTLSTCGWCKKTKTLLEELGIGYDYIDVDLLNADEMTEAKEQLMKWNGSCSFPTIIVGEEKCIVGYRESEIREVVGK